MASASPTTTAPRASTRDRQNCRDAGGPCQGFFESVLSSSSAAAVLAFLIVSALAATFNFGSQPALNFPENNWASWAVQDFSASKCPQIVLLGSSLMLVPVAGADANYLNRRLDGSRHHRSVYLQDSLRRLSGRAFEAFNFALPGEMPSDAYLITDFLLEHDKRPDVIVYGLGPRDFMDNILPYPAATDPFRSLSRFGDVSRMINLFMPDWLDQFNFKLGRWIYLYGLKNDLAHEFGQWLAGSMDRLVPVPEGARPWTFSQRRQILPEYKANELNRGEAFFRPAKMETFADNLNEYRKRYATVKWDTFATQMRFLAELLDVAKQRQTHVVIVSMPITDINRSLIKDYAWDAYRESVHVFAQAKGATYVDLQGSGQFNLSDFMDTVHLNSGGGRKMLDMLAGSMAQDKDVRLSLKLPQANVRGKTEIGAGTGAGAIGPGKEPLAGLDSGRQL